MRLLFFIRTNDNGEIKRSDFRDIILRLRKVGDEADVYDAATGVHYSVGEDGRLTPVETARIMKLNVISLFLWRLKALRTFAVRHRGCYDVAQFCYIREEYLILSRCLLKIAATSIVTVFGADIGSRNIIKRLFSHLVHEADIITVTGTNGKDLLRRYFRWDRISDKIVQLPLPSVIMRELSLTASTAEEAKEHLGFERDTVIVTCGSVLSPNEQYESWVPSLRYFNPAGRKVLFVFPFSYGNQALLDEYKALIDRSLPDKNYKIITGWSSDADTAMLRRATDVLINLRKSDQFAGIMLESLYAGARVITGGWLRYSYLEDNGIWHYRVSDFEALPEVLAVVAADIGDKTIDAELQHNSSVIKRDFSYDSIMSGWEEFYNRLRDQSDEDVKQ